MCLCVCVCVCVCVKERDREVGGREGHTDRQRDGESMQVCPSVRGTGAKLKQESMLQPQNCGFLCKFLNLIS